MVGNAAEFVDGGKGEMKRIRGGSYDSQCEIFGLAWANNHYMACDIEDESVGFRIAFDGENASKCAGVLIERDTPEFVEIGIRRAPIGCPVEFLDVLLRRYNLSSSFVGSLKKHELHIERIRPFLLTRYPITNLQYWSFVAETGYPYPEHWLRQPHVWEGAETFGRSGCDEKVPFLRKYRDHPVVCISRDDAAAYCNWLHKKTGRVYRLPTAIEWEAAARGNDGRLYPWGDAYDASRCSGRSTALARTVEVHQYSDSKSPFGCHQMTGNVSEWSSSEDQGLALICGGAFDDALELYGLAFVPVRTEPDRRQRTIGFRVLCERS